MELKTREEDITTAELACVGIPPKQPVRGERKKMMKPSTEDHAKGKFHEVKGEIKEEVGKATNDPNLEVAGKAERQAGKVQKWIGRVEKAVGE